MGSLNKERYVYLLEAKRSSQLLSGSWELVTAMNPRLDFQEVLLILRGYDPVSDKEIQDTD